MVDLNSGPSDVSYKPVYIIPFGSYNAFNLMIVVLVHCTGTVYVCMTFITSIR